MQDPTRFPDGVSTTVDGVFRDFPYPDPSKCIYEFNDFHSYVAGEWTVTETQAGATQALANGLGGWLVLTNSAADDDLVSLQKAIKSYQLTKGKRTFFEARFKVSEALQSEVGFGLMITDTDPLTFTDGIVLKKDDGDALVDFASLKDSAGSTATAIGTIASDTFTKWSFYYDGRDMHVYVGGKKVSIISSAVIPDDELLHPTFYVKNGEAVAKVLTIDYFMVAQER